jgi:hypothetical protein
MSLTMKPGTRPAHKGGLVDVPSHKVASGVGAILGGVAVGATVGTVAGPIGTIVGAAAGAVAGGLGGDAIANAIDQVSEEAHWKENYQSRPYITEDSDYEDFGPAYNYGVVAFTRYPDRDFDEVQSDLSEGWHAARGRSTLPWEEAQPAAQDAWERLAIRARRGEFAR